MGATKMLDLDRGTLEVIYTAARDGMNIYLHDILSKLHPEKLQNMAINTGFSMYDGQAMSPFMVAAYHGKIAVLKMLLEKYKPDLENELPMIYDSTVIEGVTALWCAVGAGHLDCVKVLVKAGAKVNHWTKTHSTPIRAACYTGRMDIIKYLLAHKADIYLPNIYDNTCLMIAASRGHYDVVEFLLDLGLRPNDEARCGATALHYAAEGGHTEICELLLNRGALVKKNDIGLTPVLLAAERPHTTTVTVFVEWKDLMTKEEKIEALELLGASHAANEKDSESLHKAYTYLMMAMEMRYCDNRHVIRKNLLPPVAAYDSWIECQTVAEVQAIKYNSHSMHMEALTIRERILGRDYPDLVNVVIYRGAVSADHGRFDTCQNLWHHALFIRQSNGVQVSNDLQRFAQLFTQMYTQKIPLNIPSLITVLSSCVVEMTRTTKRINAISAKDDSEELFEEADLNLLSTLYLICLVTKALRKARKTVDSQDLESVYKVVREIVTMDMRFRNGQTLLHLACSSFLPMDDFRTWENLKFPCRDTVKLLLHCGANTNELDFERNNCLHVLIGSVRDYPSYNALLNVEMILNKLIMAGVHIDAVNDDGQIPKNTTRTERLRSIVRVYEARQIRLVCLAAHRIGSSRIPYKGIVPTQLEPFVDLHCKRIPPKST
ncbi:Protein fem-1 homolog B [Sergentomyia squamirostris]